MKHKIQWTIKHFEELTALEYHHILALRISIFIVEQDCPYQDADHKDLQSYHVYGTIDDKVAAVVRIVSPEIGRASCRERLKKSEGAESIKKQKK